MSIPAKMMVEISKTTNNEVGDGTTSTVVLAGSLLEKAEELIDKNVHPTVIVEGFKKATAKAIDTLKETAIKVDSQYNDFLNKISVTSMASKTLSGDAHYLSKIVADLILAITGKISADKIKAIEQPLTAYILLQSIFFVSP